MLDLDEPIVSRANLDRLYIGGRWIAPSTSATFEVVNPATETVVAQVAAAGPDDVAAAVAAARKAFDEGPWPRTTPAERAVRIRALADALESRASQLDHAWLSQIGAPIRIADGSSAGAIGLLRYYADLCETFPFEDVRPSGGYASKFAVVTREPVGVVAAIAPWNGPLMTLVMKLAPALAAGCVVIAKPSPETPLEAFLVAEAFEEAGFPDGVYNLLPADRDVADRLVRHPGVDKVAFTGSTVAGQHVAAVCAARMARYTMELGGKSAAIVLDDMPPEQVGPMLAPIVTGNCGQACINFSRVLVPRKRYADYVESLAASMGAVKVGDPLDRATEMGPMAMKRQLERVLGYIDKGREQGAQVATGGGRPAHMNRGYFIEPTVLAKVSNDMIVAQEEIFGPVTAMIAYDDEEEAIRLANDSDFGLSGGVFTQDADHAYAVGRRIRTGTFTHNGQEFDLTNPFGGFKRSGIGREGGREGIEPYLETKSIFLPSVPSHLRT